MFHRFRRRIRFQKALRELVEDPQTQELMYRLRLLELEERQESLPPGTCYCQNCYCQQDQKE